MEINKQLFEDILSGKLKGTFVLRDKQEISSTEFTRNYLFYSKSHPYKLRGITYTSNGLSSLFDKKTYNDIINFIPNTDMKEENESTIEIPDGKIVDWDESKKQNKIILKNKQITYKDIWIKLSDKNGHFYIDGLGDIEHSYTNPGLLNVAPSEHQLKCILAKNQLANVAKYLNDGWKPWHDKDIASIVLLAETKTGVSAYEVINGSTASYCGSIWFKSKELARQAIEILGEETVKLALEPLGI